MHFSSVHRLSSHAGAKLAVGGSTEGFTILKTLLMQATIVEMSSKQPCHVGYIKSCQEYISDRVARKKEFQLKHCSRQKYWTLQSNPLIEHLKAYEEEAYCANLSCL